MKSDLFTGEHLAGTADSPGMTLQNATSVTYTVDDETHARRGSTTAFRGTN